MIVTIYELYLLYFHCISFEQEAKSLYRSAMEEAETEAEEFVKTGNDFRSNWRSNIDTVIEMYTMLL